MKFNIVIKSTNGATIESLERDCSAQFSFGRYNDMDLQPGDIRHRICKVRRLYFDHWRTFVNGILWDDHVTAAEFEARHPHISLAAVDHIELRPVKEFDKEMGSAILPEYRELLEHNSERSAQPDQFARFKYALEDFERTYQESFRSPGMKDYEALCIWRDEEKSRFLLELEHQRLTGKDDNSSCSFLSSLFATTSALFSTSQNKSEQNLSEAAAARATRSNDSCVVQ